MQEAGAARSRGDRKIRQQALSVVGRVREEMAHQAPSPAVRWTVVSPLRIGSPGGEHGFGGIY